MVDKILAQAEQAAIAGARAMVTLLQSGTPVQAQRKSDNTFVLNLDLASEAAIVAELSKTGLPIISEEQESTHALVHSMTDAYLVDPLDGTNNCRRFLEFFGLPFRPMSEGFGPLIGVVQGGELVGAAFVNLADGQLYAARRGAGAWRCAWQGAVCGEFTGRKRLMAPRKDKLFDAGVLFYPGRRGEIQFIDFLRSGDLVDAVYRLGGFAHDCVRLAKGWEHLLIQYSLKAWDLSAALIAAEAGCTVKLHGQALGSIRPQPINRALVINAGIVGELEALLAKNPTLL